MGVCSCAWRRRSCNRTMLGSTWRSVIWSCPICMDARPMIVTLAVTRANRLLGAIAPRNMTCETKRSSAIKSLSFNQRLYFRVDNFICVRLNMGDKFCSCISRARRARVERRLRKWWFSASAKRYATYNSWSVRKVSILVVQTNATNAL